MEKEFKEIVVFQERMAGWLMFNRFHKIAERADLKESKRNIYVFKDSPEIRVVMEDFNKIKSSI